MSTSCAKKLNIFRKSFGTLARPRSLRAHKPRHRRRQHHMLYLIRGPRRQPAPMGSDNARGAVPLLLRATPASGHLQQDVARRACWERRFLHIPSETGHYYTGSSQFVFDAPFFAPYNLTENLNHTVAWVLRGSSSNDTIGLLDYAVVTVKNGAATSPSPASEMSSPPFTSKKSKTKTIIGAVLGAVGALLVLALAAFLLQRRRQNGAPVEPPAEDVPARACRVRADYVAHPFAVQPPPPPASVSESTTRSSDMAEPETRSLTPPSSLHLDADAEVSTLAPTETTAPSSPTLSTRERLLEERLAFARLPSSWPSLDDSSASPPTSDAPPSLTANRPYTWLSAAYEI
ncbi:hypothetical protein DFH09DRAFT_1076650 [Mycena vulgaris]|nr:hypothetical protein DFH09DRAFT_1076650 [Mycena vulgaris]